MPVASLLTSLEDFNGSPTFPGYGGGQGAGVNTDIIIEGTQSGGRRVDAATDAGFGASFTAANLSGAGEHVKVWLFVTQWRSVTQVQIRISSGADDDHEFPVAEYPSLGGFVPVWVDVSRAPEVGGTANEASISEVGVLLDIGNVGGNAPNLIIDEIMHGTSGLKWTGTGGTVADFISYEDTNNEGSLVALNGVNFLYSRLESGDTTADTFVDSGFTIICPDQSLVSDTFMGWTLRGTDSLTNGTFGSANPLGATKRPDLICEGAQTLSGMTLPGLRLLQLNAASSLVSGSSALVQELTQNGGTISDSAISCLSAAGVAVCDDFDATTASNVTWSQAGSGHAIEITAPGTYDFDAQFFTGFGSNGANDAAIYNNSGGAVTINVLSGGDNPTFRDGTGASTAVVNSVTVTLNDLVAGSVVYILNTTDSVEIARLVEPTSTFSTTVNYTADKALLIRVRNHSSAPFYQDFQATGTLTAAGFNLNVNQLLD